MGVKISSFRDLIVWQKAMRLVELVYSITNDFPSDERYALTSQLKRAAVSVPSNIAEGYGRNSTVDYIRFLKVSLGSLDELNTQLELAGRLNFMPEDTVKDALELCDEIEKMLVTLVSKLRAKIEGESLVPTAWCLLPPISWRKKCILLGYTRRL
jgi:four helix bundle protein